MFSIGTINDKIQLVTNTGADINVTVSYNDFELVDVGMMNLIQPTIGEQSTTITTASTTDILNAPSENTSRTVRRISIRNIDVSITNTIYVQLNINGVPYVITPSVPLATGEQYEYESGSGWRRLDASGKTMSSGIRTYYGTSVNNMSIGGGTKTFDTQAGLAYIVGQRVRLTYNANNFMSGEITSYTGTVMEVNIDFKRGSGSYSSWVLSPTEDQIVPDGGTSGQILAKASGTSYDVTWVNAGTATAGNIVIRCGDRVSGGTSAIIRLGNRV